MRLQYFSPKQLTGVLYYIEKTDRRGRKEIIAVLRETENFVFGRIAASEIDRSSEGDYWSNRKTAICNRYREGRYDFTKSPQALRT